MNMIRQSVLVFLCFFVSIEMNAQIQRSFYDLSLGTSTQKEVKRYFKSNKKTIIKRGNDEIYVKDLKFGGHIWPYTVFKFYKDKLKNVFFSDIKEGTDREALNLYWITLRIQIDDKYINYAAKETSNDNLKYYDDGVTTLMISYNKTQVDNRISLLYSDKEMGDAEMKEDKNDF